MNYTKKYGKGWFFESERHRLARKGVKTSKNSNKIMKGTVGGALAGGIYGGLVAGPVGIVYGGVMGSGIGAGIGSAFTKNKIKKNYARLSTEQQINAILFNLKSDAVDKEVLTIEIPKDKSRNLDFLKSYTKFNTTGRWMGINEDNIQVEIEFRDSKDEKYGKKLMSLFNKLNKEKVKEKVLYVRTEPVEESSLNYSKKMLEETKRKISLGKLSVETKKQLRKIEKQEEELRK